MVRKEKEHKLNLVIIGGGPAAITIAKTIQDKMKVTIIRPEDHSMIYCAMPYAIENLLTFEKTFKSDNIVFDAKAELIRDTVSNVDFDTKTISMEKNKDINYDKLIIATGAVPILPPIEGNRRSNVMTFKTEDDLKKIIDLVDNGLQKAVVVGAGAIGIELAQALNERKVETHLVDMAESILPNMMDIDMIEETQETLIRAGVHLHLKSKVEAIQVKGKTEEIILDNNKVIPLSSFDDNCTELDKETTTGLVVFAVGMRPTVGIFEGTKLEIEKDGIVINNKMETNIPDVYAVGDCCQFTSALTGEVISGKLATNAVPMGRVLAFNLLGQNREYPGFYNGAATKINDVFLGGTGFTEATARKNFEVEVGYAEFTTAFPIMPSAKKVKLKLIADKNTHKIIGGQFISGEPVADKVDQITMALQFGITVEQLTSFSYSSQPYQSFYPAHNLIVKAAEEILKKFQVPSQN
ncbi:MAG: FAD-dependent pyridine nucleotide-disulfide oxidoreductase [Candidatus Parabeggiatoa sp. nov. 2]|nr:MAG: FAD-dependent pyridine nucleotide-disulfide oxidoreductase [Beggiatoa sp. 4572_84]